jgi:trk system potassium uptake protein TrkA
MNLLVIGCGRVGSDLAYRLYKQGHKVCVIDQTEKAFSNLPDDFRGRTLEGEALNQHLLHRAGIEKVDGVAVVTGSDTLNAVVGHISKSIFKVPNVIVRNYDPHFRGIFEAFNLQTVSSSSWGAQRIEELLYGQEVRTVFSAGNGEIELYEFMIPQDWEGKSLDDLLPGEGCCATAITRHGRALLPDMNMQIHKDDILLVSATLEGAEILRKNLDKNNQVEA